MRRKKLEPSREWENQYRKTDEIEYAVLTLGKFGRMAPDWAFLACSKFFLEAERCSTGRSPEDDKDLDRMAELVVSGRAKNKHQAAQIVTGDEINSSNIRRLLRLWDGEQKDDDPEIEEPSLWCHPRCERALVRRAMQTGTFLAGAYNPYIVPPPVSEDNKLLEMMAEMIISGSAKTEREAARKVIGGDDRINLNSIDCLLRLWDAERRATFPEVKRPDPRSHPRCKHALLRQSKQTGNFLDPINPHAVPPPDPETE